MTAPNRPDPRAVIEAYLHEHIPLSAAMGVEVVQCSDQSVVLRAPLAPNINHRCTAFGGSISTIAILAAWSWLHFTLRERNREVRLVIQSNQIDYVEPVTGAFKAECPGVDAGDFEHFLKTLDRHGRARLKVRSTVRCGAQIGATFRGEFVALEIPR